MIDISLELLSSDLVNMQYLALININRLYDLFVYHNLINSGRYHTCYVPLSRRQLNSNSTLNLNENLISKNLSDRVSKSSKISNLFRRVSRENEDKRSSSINNPTNQNHSKLIFPSTTNQINLSDETNRNHSCTTSKTWIPLYSNENINPISMTNNSSSSVYQNSTKTSSPELFDRTSSKSPLLNLENRIQISDEISNPIYTYEPFSLLYQIEPAHLLRLMRKRLDDHRSEFNNRPKCVPSTRSPLCTHHCVLILAARILTILSQDHSFQWRLIESKENLAIILDMLNINNDPVIIFYSLTIKLNKK